jgi:arylsulfatase A-like enzyme
VIPTPNLDRIAASGLRYTNFNSTALCSPTRAAIITGRNHHSMGFGVVAEQATGYPGYDSFMTRDKATIGKILKDHGYWTSWFGKDHNTPDFQASQAGPFDQWPIGMGFDYFYGFVGGDANPGPTARRHRRDPARPAASQSRRRPRRVHLGRRDHRDAERRRADHPQRVVCLQGRGRHSAGRGRRHDRDPGRPVRRLWVLPAEGQAGVPVQLRRSAARSLGGTGSPVAGQAHARVRLQV